MKVGRKRNERRESWRVKYGLSDERAHKLMRTDRFLNQLGDCKDDMARRLILGLERDVVCVALRSNRLTRRKA